MAATAKIDLSNERLHVRDLADSLGGRARAIGAAALIAAILWAWLGGHGASFLRGYVINFMFFLSLALGGLLFVLIQHVTKAGWSVVVRRFAENTALTVQVLAVLSLPLVIPIMAGSQAAKEVYPWTVSWESMVAEHDDLLIGKYPYLNQPFFFMRIALYFLVWIAIARFFRGSSVLQDETGDPALTERMQWWSPLSILATALTLTFCAIDLLMTLDPYWFSTIFGVYYFAGAFLGFMCLTAAVFLLLQRSGRVVNAISTEHYHDIGKLMFAFVVFWAYICFSQYMLIWYANIPEETVFIYARHSGVWGGLSLMMLFGHFVLPFLFLITRLTKRNPGPLMFAALWLLVMHWLDMVWLVLPQVHIPLHSTSLESVVVSQLQVMDVAFAALCFVGVGGLWLWSLLSNMGAAALIPQKDPRLQSSLAFQNY